MLENISLHFKEPDPKIQYGDDVDLDDPDPSQVSAESASGVYLDEKNLISQAFIGRIERIRIFR